MSYFDYNNPNHLAYWVVIRRGRLYLKNPSLPISRLHLHEKRELFFNWLEEHKYSSKTIKNFSWLYNLIEKGQGSHNISFYNQLLWRFYKSKRRVYVLQLLVYDFYDVFPLTGKLFLSSHYYKLTKEYQELVDSCVECSLKKQTKRSVNGAASLLCVFLSYLIDHGITRIEELTERTIQDYMFLGKVNVMSLSRIGNMLKTYYTDTNNIEALRIIELFPSGPRRKKVFSPLTEEEQNVLEDYILSPTSQISHRDRAIASILYYYGVRGGECRELQLDDINFQTSRITFRNSKTKKILEFKLEPVVGNAIYNYLKFERPSSTSKYCFLGGRKQRDQVFLVNNAVVMNSIYDKLGIRKGTTRGTHIIRHNFADRLINNNIMLPVVQELMGHENPETTEGYISANIEQLRTCCLSIDTFPINDKTEPYEDKK